MRWTKPASAELDFLETVEALEACLKHPLAQPAGSARAMVAVARTHYGSGLWSSCSNSLVSSEFIFRLSSRQSSAESFSSEVHVLQNACRSCCLEFCLVCRLPLLWDLHCQWGTGMGRVGKWAWFHLQSRRASMVIMDVYFCTIALMNQES